MCLILDVLSLLVPANINEYLSLGSLAKSALALFRGAAITRSLRVILSLSTLRGIPGKSLVIGSLEPP